jgi:hypothetical protein
MKRLVALSSAASLAALCACAPLATPATTVDKDGNQIDLDLLSWCPLPEPTTQVEEDKLWLQFTEDARYCSVMPAGTWDTETRVEMWDALGLRMQLQLVPGDIFLPREPGEYEVRAPLCARRAGSEAIAPEGRARLVVEDESQLGQSRKRYILEQQMLRENGDPMTFRLQWSGFDWALAGGMQLDGTPWPAGSDPNVSMFLCEGTTCAPPAEDSEEDPAGVLRWDACRFEDGGTESYEINFEGGSLSLDIENAGSPYQFRNAITAARGDVLGSSFEQTSYWHLGMRESYPYSYSRDVAVVFDEPIGAFCGLEVQELYLGNWANGVVLKRCDGGPDEARAVITIEWEWNEPEEEPTEDPPPVSP